MNFYFSFQKLELNLLWWLECSWVASAVRFLGKDCTTFFIGSLYEKNIFLLQIFGILCPWCLVCCDSHHDQSRSCHWKCLRDHLYFYVLCNRIWPSCGTNFCKFFFAWQFTIGHNLSFDTFIHEIVDFSRETFEYCKIFKEGNKNMENIFSFWQIQGFFWPRVLLEWSLEWAL